MSNWSFITTFTKNWAPPPLVTGKKVKGEITSLFYVSMEDILLYTIIMLVFDL